MAQSLGDLIYTLALNSKNFTKDLQKASGGMQAFGKKAKDIGKSLTKNLTLPIVGLGIAAIKLAADAQIAGRKFEKAFAGSLDKAAESVTKLNDSFGISNTLAKQLLGNTGDLLKGFGATSDQALTTSLQVQELAASLAAYNGVPVEQASKAITAALLGETEQLKTLGVVIRQADVDKQSLADGTAGLTGQEKLLARAQSTLTLAMGQSSDAMDSFAGNQDTVAFQTQALLGDLKDLGVQFGTILLPIVKDMVEGLRDLVKWFGDLDEGTQKSIISILAIGAAAGPVVGTVGNLAKGFGDLAKAAPKIGSTLVKLGAAAGPIALIGIAAAAAAIGWWELKKASLSFVQELRDKEINEKLGEVADNMDRIGDGQASQRRANALAAMEEGFKKINFGVQVSHLGELEEQLIRSSEQYGIQAGALLDAAVATSGYRDEIAKEIDALREIAKEIDEKEAAAVAYDIAATKRKEEEAIATAKQLQLEEDRRNGVDELSLAYQAQRARVLSVLGEEKSETEKLKDQITELNMAWAAGSGLESDRLRAIAVLEARIQEIADAEEALFYEEQARVYEGKATADEIYQAKMDAIQEEADAKELAWQLELQRAQESIDLALTVSGVISDIYNGLIQNQINGIELQKNADLTALDERVENQMQALNAQNLNEEEYTKAKLKIEKDAADDEEAIDKETAKKKYEIEKEAFAVKQAFSVAEIILNTASAIVKGYADLGPIGGTAFAVIMGILGGVQVSNVLSTPPPAPPRLAEGGLINPSIGGTHAIIGEAGSQEAVIPLNDAFFERLANAAKGSTLGGVGGTGGSDSGSDTTIVIQLDGETIAESTVNLINNRRVLVNASSII